MKETNFNIVILTSRTPLCTDILATYLVKKFPTFYGIRRFITVFRRGCQLTMSWSRWVVLGGTKIDISCLFIIVQSATCFLIDGSEFPTLICGSLSFKERQIGLELREQCRVAEACIVPSAKSCYEHTIVCMYWMFLPKWPSSDTWSFYNSLTSFCYGSLH
jgi:hypothetical protein